MIDSLSFSQADGSEKMSSKKKLQLLILPLKTIDC